MGVSEEEKAMILRHRKQVLTRTPMDVSEEERIMILRMRREKVTSSIPCSSSTLEECAVEAPVKKKGKSSSSTLEECAAEAPVKKKGKIENSSVKNDTAGLKHAHAGLHAFMAMQMTSGRDTDLLKYLPLVDRSGLADRMRMFLDARSFRYTMCGRFQNLKNVRNALEWQTRVVEYGGKVKFQTHNDKKINLCGSLQGFVAVKYDRLVEVFGDPLNCNDTDQTDWDWNIEFEDGITASIYNCKDGDAKGLTKHQLGTGEYMPDYGRADWHVGGESPQAVSHVENALNFS